MGSVASVVGGVFGTNAAAAEYAKREMEVLEEDLQLAIQRLEEATQREKQALKREEESQKHAAEVSKLAQEMVRMAEDSKRREELSRERDAEYQRLAEEATKNADVSRMLAEEATTKTEEAKREAEEARRGEEEALEREKEIKQRAEQERAIAEDEAAEMQRILDKQALFLSKGIQPVEPPTAEEFEAAKARVEYRVDRLHFAICGGSGTGKSSLINAIRGLQDFDSTRAAPTGIVETTMDISPYPDPRNEHPYSRFIWFDVPGAGTLEISDWQYFNQQGLFIFDAMVLVYDDRFTKIDIAIIDNCRRYHIPVFIVRSKVDQYIRSTMKIRGYTKQQKAEKAHFYTNARAEVINATRQNVKANLQKAGLPMQQVYIISSETMYDMVSGKKNLTSQIIDEAHLLHDLLGVAEERIRTIDSTNTPPIERSNQLCKIAAATAAACGTRDLDNPTPSSR